MSSQPATARRIGVALLAAGSVLLTSCAAGKHAATANQQPPIDGTNGTVGALQLQAVAVLSPAKGDVTLKQGTSAPLTLVLVNNGSSDDTLTQVSSPAAQGWGVFDSAAAASAAASPSSSASGSGSGTESATSHTSASATAVATKLAIGAGQRVPVAIGSASKALLLIGLTKALYPAQSVQITFTFAKAGAVTLTVPVQTSIEPASSTIPAPSGAAE